MSLETTARTKANPWPFRVALAVFLAWITGLGVLAYTTSEKPRPNPVETAPGAS